MLKPLKFLGDSYKHYVAFSEAALDSFGYNLHLVQMNEEPWDWKPMNSIGHGVRELRFRDETGAFRVIYYAKLSDGVYVLHCFQKKTQKIAKSDLELASNRLKNLLKG
jgi:phage-related protein